MLKIIRLILISVLIVMVTVIIIEILLRYAFGFSLFWPEEVARFIMFYIALVGSTIALKEKKHPVLSLIVRKIPVKYRKKYFYLIDGMVLFVLIVMFRMGYLMTVDEWMARTPALRISYGWVYIAIPIGALLMMIQIIANRIFEKKSSIEEE